MASTPLDPQLYRRLTRYLHLANEAPVYYPGCWSSHKRFEVDKLKAIDEALQANNNNTQIVDIIVKAYKDGWYTRYESIAFALAKCLLLGGPQVKEAGYKAVGEICQTPEELMLFSKYTRIFKTGSGQGWCKSVRMWYKSRDPMDLAKQLTRVKARHGRSHSVLISKSHIKVDAADVVRDAVIKYAIFGLKQAKQLMANKEGTKEVFDYIQKVEDMRHCEDPVAAAAMALQHKFTLDHVPGHLLTSQEVWDAVLPQFSLEDILNNLQRIHNMGFLTSDSTTTGIIVSLLSNKDLIKKSKLTPLAIYITICNYKKKCQPMKYAKEKVAKEKTARRRSRQIFDSNSGLWEWTVTRRHPKEIKHWGIDQPPNQTILVALKKLMDQSWLLTPPVGGRYMITLDMRHHMFKGRHFCKQYSVPKQEKKKAKPAAGGGGGGDADNAETKNSRKHLFAECFFNKTVTPGHAAIILALHLLKREKHVRLAVFTEEGVQMVTVERNFTSIEEAEFLLRNANNGRVQLDAPIQWATKVKAKIDVFLNIVDRTTRYMELDLQARGGRGQGGRFGPPPNNPLNPRVDHCPVRALQRYRDQCKQPNSKLIVMALASHRVATSDGSHSGILDMVGVDEHTPKVLDAFIKGQFL